MNRNALLLLLAVTVPGWGGEPASPPAPGIGPGEVPVIDVEANVRRMLEESRARQGAAPAAQTPPAPADTKATARPEPPGAKPAAAKPAAPPARPPAPAPGEYLPLPEETITIRSVDDVKAVHEHIQDARRRNGGTPAPNATPGQ